MSALLDADGRHVAHVDAALHELHRVLPLFLFALVVHRNEKRLTTLENQINGHFIQLVQNRNLAGQMNGQVRLKLAEL